MAPIIDAEKLLASFASITDVIGPDYWKYYKIFDPKPHEKKLLLN